MASMISKEMLCSDFGLSLHSHDRCAMAEIDRRSASAQSMSCKVQAMSSCRTHSGTPMRGMLEGHMPTASAPQAVHAYAVGICMHSFKAKIAR